MTVKKKKKAIVVSDKSVPDAHPIGTLLRWDKPPMCRVGAYGNTVAPSNRGEVSMVISGTHLVRFFYKNPFGDVCMSEPLAVEQGQACEIDPEHYA